MTSLRSILLCLFVAMASSYVVAQQASTTASLTATEIMAKVASNQDRAESARRHYIYVQHARVSSRKGATVMCEEVTESRITPTETGSHAELLTLDGRMLVKKKYVTYTALPTDEDVSTKEKDKDEAPVKAEKHTLTIDTGDDDTDRDLVEHMRSNLTNDDSKDGINGGLFPLVSKSQADYVFQLAGRERMRGREVYHVTFRPKVKDEFGWEGDAYVDVASFQPVMVRTGMAKKIPLAVRTLLGTNLPGLGFTVFYAPQADGVWFPVEFGTEFKLRVLFFFSRKIVIDAQNKDFQKTHSTATVTGMDGKPIPQ